MQIFKALLTATIILLSAANHAANAEAAQITPSKSETISIDVTGTIPGFTQAQLTRYLTRKMQAEIPAPWHFIEGKPEDEFAPDRIVWTFSTLRRIWKGGSHNGFPSPQNLEIYLRVEVKLYLRGAYQMTMVSHPSVDSEPDNQTLSTMVHDAAHALFIENNTDEP